MSATNVASRGIVHEVLTEDNYEDWSVLVKNYLMGRGLWDVVESNAEIREETTKKCEARRRKNAEALHIIHLSCNSEVLSQIKGFGTAKEAWNQLKSSFSKDSQADPDIEQGVADGNLQEEEIKLHRFVESGNWACAESIIHRYPESINSTSSRGRTVLHVAVIAGHEDIVRKLMDQPGGKELLKMRDSGGYTALALAAYLTGNTNIARCMVEKCGELVAMGTKVDEIPVLLAAASGDKQMTLYLFGETGRDELAGNRIGNSVLLLRQCIAAEIFEVALRLLRRIPELLQANQPEILRSLNELAHMPSAFASGSRFGFIQQFFYSILILGPTWSESDGNTNEIVRVADEEERSQRTNSLANRLLRSVQLFFQNIILLHLPGIREIYDKKLTHRVVILILRCFSQRISRMRNEQIEKTCAYDAMLQAAKYGIIEFIHEMRQANPDLLWAIDKNKRGIFSYAVLNRRKEVFQLIRSVNGRKEIIRTRADTFGNNLLHLAGHLGPPSDLDRRSGAALQMQRELQWFEAVEKLVRPKCKQTKNKDGKYPRDVFTEHHAELVKAGEKWAKDTASSFILVSILITTIMFAAAFTVPGGNDPKTGIPSLSHDRLFDVFAIADAVSLFTSASSVLVFSGILTSRYAENDFRYSLPWKLMVGLCTLFSSVVAMMVAFCAAVGMMLKGYPQSTVRTILGFASIPVLVLVPMQLSLFLQFFDSTASPLLKQVGSYLLVIFSKCFGFMLRKK